MKPIRMIATAGGFRILGATRFRIATQEEPMLHLAVHRVRDDKITQLEKWLRSAEHRIEEVRSTMRDEGVTHEQAHLLHTSEGALLIRVVESADFEAARRVFEQSTHPIDAEHKAVLADVLDYEVSTLLLLDIRQ